MTPELFFLLLSILAFIGWFTLIVISPFWKFTDKFLIGIIITLLSLVYSYLNFGHINEAGGPTSFLTFEGVTQVFANPYLLVGGWAHILAIDLMVGIWIKNNAAKNDIQYAVVVPVLLLTLMFTPLGLLVYQGIRWSKTRQYFVNLEYDCPTGD